eukprot:2158182-Pleurochrysis_carterae.AAC.3
MSTQYSRCPEPVPWRAATSLQETKRACQPLSPGQYATSTNIVEISPTLYMEIRWIEVTDQGIVNVVKIA